MCMYRRPVLLLMLTLYIEAEALSNCPAPADTSEQSASKADPAIDGNLPILETYRCPLCSC